VNRKQAFQMGIFSVACNRYRRIQVKFKVEAIGRLLYMGDVCSISHPYFCNLATGETELWNRDNRTIDLGIEGQKITQEPQIPDKYLVINKPSGHPWGPCRIAQIKDGVAILDNYDLRLLIRQGAGDPFVLMDQIREKNGTPVWIVQDSKEFAGRVIIQSVIPSDLYHYEVTAINDSDLVDQYENLPVPIWNYRGLQSSEEGITTLTAPKDFDPRVKGDSINATVDLFWGAVAGASYYEVEVKIGSGTFYPLGKTNTNYIAANLSQGANTFRVRAVSSNGVIGPYGECLVDTVEAFAPAVDIKVVSFEAGDLILSWTYPTITGQSVFYEETILEIMVPETRRVLRTEWLFSNSQGNPPTTFTYTRTNAVQDGGLLRELLISIKYSFSINSISVQGRKVTSQPAEILAEDTPPEITGDPSYEITETSVILNSIETEGETTGFVVIRGTNNNFTINQLAEMRQTSQLPYTWDGLNPDTDYFFRLAAKDALTDLRGYYLDLIYTPVVTIHTLAEPDPDPDI
jgi:hypothetical protein